ncbi:MAG TPA: hypothetical protein VG736_11840 [Vicinamibacterales bacterium]|jgi:hypothetical protein|nr:hypothetical protein [Vicinamibacterales bacterium]
MRYAFPNDLAEQVIARWQTFVARHDRPAPPLPSPECLRYILETAFFASFAREEDRELRFVLCCVPAMTVPRDGGGQVPVMRFQSARPLSIQSLRSVAPAVSAQNAALLVRFGAGVDEPSGCELAGVLNVGSHLSRSRSGRSFYNRPSPYALIIDVRDAGEMHIYRGGIKLATLKSGQLHDQLAYSGLEFLPISDILARGHEALRARIRPPDIEPARESADFEWTALLNTILCMVNGVNEHGHGGVLLLVAPGSERSLPVRMKFDVDERESVVADRFVDFVNARHQLAGARARAHHSGAPARSGSFSHLKNATFVAEEDLADAADVTARLSAVDGALVVRSDLAVLGFGAEIVSDATQPLNAFEVTGHPLRGSDWPAVDVESFGMRHRSALRCIAAADGAAAFVVSQDATVTFVWKQDGRLLLKRNVNTSNPNMVGA